MAGREGAGMGRVGKDTVGGGLQATSVCLLWTAEVTPIRVGIIESGHLRHR